ncbi:MAG: glycoside hydrolase family 78 protein [Bacteroidales bacterium]|nr:glycoside hydrolase family 78 protein [Bacteroidales bacterium]
MKKSLLILALAAFAASCTPKSVTVGTKTDALADEAWAASEWISAPDQEVVTGTIHDGSRAADGSSWFVAKVENDAKVVSAKWMTAGLGVYELYLNAQPVGEEFLKPGFTHYAKTKRSFTYDISDAFLKGAGDVNVLAVEMTPGWWGDKIVTPAGHEGFIGRKTAFRGVLELTFANGETRLFGTDTENWKAGIAGPVKHGDIFDGEIYDAREALGYEVAESLGAPEANNEFAGEILPSEGAEVYLRKDLILEPVKAYVYKDIENASDDEFGKVVADREYAAGETMTVAPGETLVLDFGQNCAGVPAFLFKASEGTVLSFLPAELLNDGNGAKSRGMDGPEGSIHRTNLRIPETGMYLQYTFAESKDYVCYHPRFTFFGYRFAAITADNEVSIKKIGTIPVTSIAKELETGSIETGDELVNKLISNTVWGQRSNYLSVPTDCPQRNERLGWTADTQVFSETGTFFANTDRFFHKWMRDMRDTQNELGGYPGVAPLAQYGAEPTSMMRLGWSDAGIIVPWTVWKQFGDTSIIDECWESMELNMKHITETKYDHNALVAENGNFQWGDWLSYEDLEATSGTIWGENFPDATHYWSYLSACYWIIDSAMMADMARATGRDVAKYEAINAEAVAYVKETFLDGKGGFLNPRLNTMQTPALFALRTGLVEGEAKDALCARLRKNFEDHGNCLQTGFLGTSILMPTLTDNGMEDLAYELLFQRKNPSWLYSVDNGATTIWERWNSYMIEKGMGPAGMNSFNHYAYGCVCQWIWESVAGIAADPADPGFHHIIMKPVPDKRLGFIKASFKTAYGTIKSEWKYDGDVWSWTFTVPEGTTATVTLPGETEAKDYTSGTYSVKK